MSERQSNIGSRVRQARRAQGLTQLELASYTDRSESWVRSVEKGRIFLDKHSIIDRLADILKVDVAWLLGQPRVPASATRDPGLRAVPDLRTAIRRTGLILSGHPNIRVDQPASSIAALRRSVNELTRLRQDANLPGAMERLPVLLDQLNNALLNSQGSDLEATQGLLVESSHIARMVLNQLGHHDLAWSAVENAALVAERLGDPCVKACSAWDRCGVLLHTGSLSEAVTVAEAALANLEPRLDDPTVEVLALWGALHLRVAVAAARRGFDSDAWSHLHEAEVVAARVGTGRNDFQTVFGPLNVKIHMVEIAVELDQPDVALQQARTMDLTGMRSRERLVHHNLEIARAHGHLKHDARAVRALNAAAAMAPHYVHNHPMARALVGELRRRSQPSAVEAGLGSLQLAMLV